MRPKQWIKNVLVGAAPLCAGGIDGQVTLLVGAFASFCFVASGAYCINDAIDVTRDRAHPRKKMRPVAAGHVPVAVAIGVGCVLIAAGLLVAIAIGTAFGLVVAVYSIYTFTYTFYLKHIPVVELVALTGGFVLRVIAGAAATATTITAWFFVAVAGGALLMASGKRMAELEHGGSTRSVLAVYTAPFLYIVQAAAVSLFLSSYAMWAFTGVALRVGVAQLSFVPLSTAVLRYAHIASLGQGGEPESVIIHDRILLACGAAWFVLLVSAVGGM